ncbi:peptidyl-prolyl cis-trans isomerase [Ulvibacter antarcticus]|uniref:Peptidylprolyl isomerase n=1 Tax=Ulvibacter antarcticus TaxID=442714 RepID=A0A3L9YFB7_9FLAO|nr:peptidyl-prolyl cis-trans isomerase [Ulvibacter antarcticus]RMA58050.1 hypothetical protein BXY75_2858 [Ulvibacter antarcticus]
MQKTVWIILIAFTLVSCEYFKQGPSETPVARVNDNYLYKKDLVDLTFEGTSKEDSILIVTNYINRWATQKLLIDQAKINLSQEKLNNFNNLVQQYKNDLYTEAYKSAIIAQQMDNTISNKEYDEFYELNKENFKLNDELIQIRFIHLDKNYSNIRETKDKFVRFNASDKKELSDLSIQFKAVNLNDSIWIEKNAIFKALPVVEANSSQVLKKSNFTQLQDSLGVYLVKIENLLKPNDLAPLSHIKPTIEQIILNKRKLELIKELEKDITKDAIKNDDFEIYTPN